MFPVRISYRDERALYARSEHSIGRERWSEGVSRAARCQHRCYTTTYYASTRSQDASLLFRSSTQSTSPCPPHSALIGTKTHAVTHSLTRTTLPHLTSPCSAQSYGSIDATSSTVPSFIYTFLSRVSSRGRGQSLYDLTPHKHDRVQGASRTYDMRDQQAQLPFHPVHVQSSALAGRDSCCF
jgi:hypothetical protein